VVCLLTATGTVILFSLIKRKLVVDPFSESDVLSKAEQVRFVTGVMPPKEI
jgi:hypothetical protein